MLNHACELQSALPRSRHSRNGPSWLRNRSSKQERNGVWHRIGGLRMQGRGAMLGLVVFDQVLTGFCSAFLEEIFFLGAKNWTQFCFLKLFGRRGISQQDPGISRQKSLISLVSRDIPNFLAPIPSCGRPLSHRKMSGL